MSTIAENITALTNQRTVDKQHVEDANAAVRTKGVDIPLDAPLADLADNIALIEKFAGEEGSGAYLVRFFDFDGHILKQQRVNAGENATAPIPPSHQYLTFNSWNNAFTNVQSHIDTSAIYDTIDDKSYLFITLTPITGLSPTLYFYKSTTSLMTINWGDGTTSTSTTAGNQNVNHTYAAAGNYVISVENSAGGEYYFGQGGADTTTFGHYSTMYTKSICGIYIGKYVPEIKVYSFYYAYSSINRVSIPNRVINIGTQCFYNSYSLYFISLPKLCTFSTNAIDTLNGMKNIIISQIAVIGSACFARNSNINSIIIGNATTSIGASAFSQCFSLVSIIVLALIPPTLTNIDAFAGINPICKIYVPDASVNAYKTATNWVTYADYIYPLSSKP